MRLRLALLVFIATICVSQGRATAATWIAEGRPTPQAAALIQTLNDAERFGLNPGDYLDESLHRSFTAQAEQSQWQDQLTSAASTFLKDLHSGRIDPQTAGFHFPPVARPFDIQRAVDDLAASSDFAATLKTYQPRARPYWLLLDALARYRELAQTPELTELPVMQSRSIRQGDPYERAPALRRLLIAVGDLAKTDYSDSPVFDAELSTALTRFQMRYGLSADGVLGRQTFEALTTPLSKRVRQIELSLERWRWTTLLERPDIVVNVPQFMLYALPKPNDANGSVLEMGVIVGKSEPPHQTPIFTAELKRVIFQPYWDVPYSIMRKELLPLIRKDPHYLEKHDMEIVRGDRDDSPVLPNNEESIDALIAGKARLRQRPGAQNALGPIKFVLPNPYNVYLHATPEQRLFERPRRDFSHGCVRVSNPAALAEYVLRNAPQPWDMAAIQNAMCGTQTLRVDLKEPLRVMFFYSTVAATDSEGVLFAPDVYGQDAKLEGLLQTHSN
ncbi:MAG TPA: L,D-transpeptidase family protein [Steroidobacteraceae bacterium]|nr:L,D-transpeptidase family protein [Steroidobacteraceae bacterium]